MRTLANLGPCAIRWAGIALVVSTAAGAAFAHDHDLDPVAATPELTLTEASPSVVMASHTHGANMTCIALESGLVFVNSGGHTSGSSFVYFSAEAVVVAGDLVQARRRPYFGDPSTDLPLWIETLKSWQAMGAKRVCPGHGPVIEGAELTPIWRYFEALRTTLKQLKDDGVTLEEAVSRPSLPGGYWPDGDSEPPWWNPSLAVAWRGL